MNNNYIKLSELSYIHIIDGDRGKNYPSTGELMPSGFCLFLNAGNVTDKGFVFNELKYITKQKDELLRNGKLERNDIILTTRGTVGNIAIYDKFIPFDHMRINSGMVIIRVNESKIIPQYLYNILRSSNVQNQISSLKTGSAQPQLPISLIKEIKIPILDIKEQKAIADVLGSFDDKIELNNKIINNLEEQAQSLYKHWFVDFEFPNEECKPYKSSGGKFKESKLGLIPENWDVLSFGDLFKIKSGYPFKSSTYLDEGCFKIITIKNVLEDGLDTSKVSYINTLPSDLPEYCKLNIGDILVSLTGNIGRVCSVIENNLLLNQRVGKICCANNNYKNFINCILKQQCIKDMLISISRGTAQQNLSPVECLNLKIPGNLKFIEGFSKLVDGFISKNIELQIENKKLEETRDYLLQKLMNGEIKVLDVK